MQNSSDKEFTWSVYRQIHIIPDDDVKEHDIVGKCWCHPKIEWIDKVMKVTHDALDGRVIAEKLISQINNNL